MDRPRILVAGVGNSFLGDDAFGVEVVQRLARRPLPGGVCVVDFGIRGLDLAYALVDGYETVLIVDAAPRGGAPGTLYVLEPDGPAPPENGAASPIETHGVDSVKVLRLAAAMGGPVGRLLVIGCEPGPMGDLEEMSGELSVPVRAAVDEAVRLIESLLMKILGSEGEAVAGAAPRR
jgi:hydrogenase maturation protease